MLFGGGVLPRRKFELALLGLESWCLDKDRPSERRRPDLPTAHPAIKLT